MKKLPLLTLLLSACLSLSLTSTQAALAATDAPAGKTADGIAWYKGDVEAAFAEAKAANKPLFLYWGATWCPYCNQVKATIFNRQAFIERSRHFVPVYLDGDLASAQKSAARFKVRGYPTMILFRPDGSEVVRLPGEVDGARYIQVLNAGLGAQRSLKDTLLAAQNKPTTLKPDEWRLLAYHSWGQGDADIVAPKDVPRTLQALAAAAPAGDSKIRLGLNSLVASATAKTGEAAEIDKPAAVAQLTKLLGDERSARSYADVFSNYSSDLMKFLSAGDTPQTAALNRAYDSALKKLAADSRLSKTERVSALSARVALARLDTPTGPLEAGLTAAVRKGVASADKATTDIYERQSVIYAASATLGAAGLLDDADTLLKAELKRSHAPYYAMSGLASNAKKRGDSKAALDWYEQAYAASKGPATRIQWGANYLNNLVDLAPEQEARVEKVADQLLTELAATPDAFYERNLRSLERMGGKLLGWNRDGKHAAAFGRLQAKMNDICGKLPAADLQRAACQGVLDPARVAKS